MDDPEAGTLQVGCNDQDEVVINHPDLSPDEHGVGHIVFSPAQARHLASLLIQNAMKAEDERRRKDEIAKRVIMEAKAPPVDQNARELVSGLPVTPDYREINPATGMQKDYAVLTPEERHKGFVRPVRRTYVHVGKPPEGQTFEYPIRRLFPGGCGTSTTMALAIAEAFARYPGFYAGGGYCCSCMTHVPNEQLVWEGTNEGVGT